MLDLQVLLFFPPALLFHLLLEQLHEAAVVGERVPGGGGRGGRAATPGATAAGRARSRAAVRSNSSPRTDGRTGPDARLTVAPTTAAAITATAATAAATTAGVSALAAPVSFPFHDRIQQVYKSPFQIPPAN